MKESISKQSRQDICGSLAVQIQTRLHFANILADAAERNDETFPYDEVGHFITQMELAAEHFMRSVGMEVASVDD